MPSAFSNHNLPVLSRWEPRCLKGPPCIPGLLRAGSVAVERKTADREKTECKDDGESRAVSSGYSSRTEETAPSAGYCQEKPVVPSRDEGDNLRKAGREWQPRFRRSVADAEQLQEETGFPAGHFLAHAHLLAEALHLWGITDKEPDPHPLVQLLFMMGKGCISITWLARAFAHATQDSFAATRREWERDLDKEFMVKEWETAIEYPRRVSRNAKFQYIQHNILHRAYLKPATLSRTFGSLSA
ncbi:hypothetical protein NDU88_004800 [Pleurodeles waltl]|uniref:Uncharacterized protein n=1 Tax=Pleurodeles waltl TaxID=8319 RepID=A0AAV7TAN3_PLEWA|nr:hypothetical protein NDU88_004800 [Pleurodeles waltl]